MERGVLVVGSRRLEKTNIDGKHVAKKRKDAPKEKRQVIGSGGLRRETWGGSKGAASNRTECAVPEGADKRRKEKSRRASKRGLSFPVLKGSQEKVPSRGAECLLDQGQRHSY